MNKTNPTPTQQETLEQDSNEPHRWEVEPHPYSSDYDYLVTDSDIEARAAILEAAEMYLWDENDGEERTLRVKMNNKIANVAATSSPTPAELALQRLTEDRCGFCGGKTEHKPDCDHGVTAPAERTRVAGEQEKQ